MKHKLFITLLLITFGFHSFAQTADEIISKYLVKIGGVDKLKAMKSRKWIGVLTMQGADFSATIFEKPKAMMRIEFKTQGIEIIMASNGKEGWMLNPAMKKEPIKLNDEQLKDMDMTDHEFEDKFIDYKKKGHEITFLGIEELDGIKCFKIQLIKNKFNDQEDSKELCLFDTETYFPLMEVEYKTREQKSIELKTNLGDYRDVNGLMFPFFEEMKIAGQSIQKITTEKVIINEPIDDSIFEFPKN